METLVTGPTGKIYKAHDRIGQSKFFNLFKCTFDGCQVAVMKVARKTAYNGIMDKEALILQEMKKMSDKLEEEYQKTPNGIFLNYHFYFPILEETFISSENDKARISILRLDHVAKSLSDLKPLSHIVMREKARVDPRSSAWILGKLLRMLSFTQDMNISIEKIDWDNVLINRDMHYVMMFDWTSASLLSFEIAKEKIVAEISQATQAVIHVLGGNQATGKLPKHEQLKGGGYEKMLKSLIFFSGKDTFEAHREFYKLIRSIWPREFYKFTMIYE